MTVRGDLRRSRSTRGPARRSTSASRRSTAGRTTWSRSSSTTFASASRRDPPGRIGRSSHGTTIGRHGPVLDPDRDDPRRRHRRRRGRRRAVRPAPGDVRRLHGVGPVARVHRGLHPRRGPAALREHPHRVVGDRAPDDPLPRGRPADRPRGGRRRRDDHVVLFVGSGSTGGDRQARRLPRDPPAGRPRRPLRPRRPDPAAASARSSSSGPTSTTATSCPGASRSPTSSSSPRTTTGGSTSPGSRPSSIAHADRPLKIGSFSAASNVTGILSDARAISILLHRHGALSFWDFAAAAPYVAIEMGPFAATPAGRETDPLAYKDAIFISPHKFIGGPGTPGVLVARRELFRNRVPTVPGGGTVAYVNPTEHVYLDDVEHREEGGTPAIVESIRAGLVFGLKEAVGAEAIREREESFIHRAIERWSRQPEPRDPGQPRARRACRSSRSSSATPGRDGPRRPLPPPQLRRRPAQRPVRDPGARRLLVRRAVRPPAARDRPRARRHEFEREIARGCEGIKPGWVRVNFNYFISEAVFDVHPRGGRPRRPRRLAAPPAVPLRAGDRPVAPRRRARPSRRSRLRDVRYDDGGMR